jgi:hypothetical protein
VDHRPRQLLGGVRSFAVYALLAAMVALPVSVERAIESARFEDRLGAFPVEVRLSHNGYSTVDTGLTGKLYWERTGFAGLGATISVTGPPEAGGTLSSYVTPAFLRTNAAFIDHPSRVARAYGEELRSQVIGVVLLYELFAAVAGGALLLVIFRGRTPPLPQALKGSGLRRVAGYAGYTLVAIAASLLVSVGLFSQWAAGGAVDETYPMPGMGELSFSSPQTREVARQIQPFIEKNTTRIERRAADYRETVTANLEQVVPGAAGELAPREGEVVVLAEADPQGSRVGTQVREQLYPLLREQLGEGSLALRTISGDVSSNGTVAEAGFIRGEAKASPGIPVVAVKGDHDTETTVEQLEDEDVVVLDRETEEVAGLWVTGAADPAFKSLLGGLVTNNSGISEEQRGRQLREAVDDEKPVLVLVHQPLTAAGYLGVDSVEELQGSQGRVTTPWDDGVPDLPPGTVNIGHRHDADGPWVVWNTDGDQVSWTVVHQLGTSGGVEESPTFNRFSTPFSTPLKDVTVQLQYVNEDSGLETGYASIVIAPNGSVTIEDRVDVGLPGGLPGDAGELGLS